MDNCNPCAFFYGSEVDGFPAVAFGNWKLKYKKEEKL